MRSAASLLLAGLLTIACAATAPHGGKGSGAASAPLVATTVPSGAKGGSPPATAGIVAPSVRCVARPTGAPMVLVGRAIYEVGDPVHPRLLCQVANTRAHLFTGDTFEYVRRSGDTGTEVVLHSIGSGNERVIAGWPIKLLDDKGGVTGDWTPDGNTAASLVPAVDGAGRDVLQVWLFSQPETTILYQFLTPKLGEQSTPTLAFSADGQYLVSGWPASPSGYPFFVFQVGKHDPVQTLDPADRIALWSRTGHTLYLPRAGGDSRSWTPEGGFAPLAGAGGWAQMAGLSPDGSQVAYTDFADQAAQTGVRVFVYDFADHKTRMLVDKPRSEVTFVTAGWVWYFENEACSACPSGTAATGPVDAMDLASGNEQHVVFAAGESPVELQSYWSTGEFWPLPPPSPATSP